MQRCCLGKYLLSNFDQLVTEAVAADDTKRNLPLSTARLTNSFTCMLVHKYINRLKRNNRIKPDVATYAECTSSHKESMNSLGERSIGSIWQLNHVAFCMTAYSQALKCFVFFNPSKVLILIIVQQVITETALCSFHFIFCPVYNCLCILNIG